MKFKLLLFLFLAVSFNSLCQQQWFWSNPQPSGNAGLEVIFINTDTGFIINYSELLRTDDAGRSWIKSRDLTNPNDIDFYKATGMIVGRNGYVLQSNDYGLSWTSINIGIEENLLTVNIIDRDIIIISSERSIVTSYNGGINWSKSSISDQPIYTALFVTGTTGFAASSDGQLLKTKDGGKNWYASVLTGDSYGSFSTIYFANDSIGFAAHGYNNVFKTVDGGETWTEINGTSDQIYSFFFIDENTGYIAGDHGVIFKTVNGGQNWEWAGFQKGRFYGTSILSLYFTNADTGYAVGLGGRIFKTTDGGVSWQGYSPTYNIISSVYFPTPDTGYALGSVLLKTFDKGNSWHIVETEINQNLVFGHFFSADTGIVVADNSYASTMLQTYDGGKSFTEIPIYEYQRSIHSIFFFNKQVGIVSCFDGYFGGLFKTIDGGKSWEKISDKAFSQMHFVTDKIGVALNYGDLYRTTDGGHTWDKIYEVYGNLNKIYFVNEKVGYVAGEYNTVLKTTDGGMNWKELKTEYSHLLSVAFYNENIGYATGEYGDFFKTQDGGYSWKKESIPGYLTFLTVTKDKHLFAVGGEGFIQNSGTILRDSIIFDEVMITLHPVSTYTDDSAQLTGVVASNGEKIESIQFEYGLIGNFTNVISALPAYINANTADSIKAVLSNLLPDTTYQYRIKVMHKGVAYTSETMSFRTLPDITLKIAFVYSNTSSTAELLGTVVSNEQNITSIEFEYGTNSIFRNKTNAIPATVNGNTTESIKTTLTGLRAKTTYDLRIKALHKGKVHYSSVVSFTTRPEYLINIYPASINNSSVILTGFVDSYSGPITNIVFQYGDSREYKSAIASVPDNVEANGRKFVEVSLPNLNRESIYFYRLKALHNNKPVYSRDMMFKLSGGILLEATQANQISDTSAILSGLASAQGEYVDSIFFEYGTTPSFGNTINSLPNSLAGINTFDISAQLKNLLPNTKYYYRITIIHNNKAYYSNDMSFTTLKFIQDRLKAYPNPTNDYIFYEVIASNEKINTVELYNGFGKLILVDESRENKLRITDLPAGMYYLKAFGEKNIYVKTVIKY